MELLLTCLLLVPFIGAAVVALLPSGRSARSAALAVSLLTAAIAFAITAVFFTTPDVAGAGPISTHYRVAFAPHTVDRLTFPSLGFSVNLGVDAIGLWMLILTVFLMPVAVAASFGSIAEREPEYYAWMTLLLGAMVGVFVARDALLFYVFFELTLVPMFFVIGIWGGPDRRRAALKFFLFTFTGSVLTLTALIYLAMHAGGPGHPSVAITKIVAYAQDRATAAERMWCVLGILAGLAVKVPLFPVHTGLPLAHTEAPTAGSVLLAGILLKLGTYGMVRFAVPVGLIANGRVVAPGLVHAIGVLSLIGIIYGALVAWVQQDIKKLIAYSSVSHVGFCILGLVALNDYGMQGSILYMVNHGLSTGALFLTIGMIYERYHTRDIDALSGLARIMPKMAFFFVLFMMASIGLPGLNGFVSEFLTVLGAFTSPHLGAAYGVIAAVGFILGALYMLHMTAKVIFGPLKTPQDDGHGHGHDVKHADLTRRELAILAPMALACLFLGVLPNTVLESVLNPVRAIAPDDLNYSRVASNSERRQNESLAALAAQRADNLTVVTLKSNER
jgi:NADH-quinone oxidoreductase subunit M